MSGSSSAQLSARILLDGAGAVAEMQRVGTVTEREAQRMKRQLDFVNSVVKERALLEAQAGKAAQQAQATIKSAGQSAAQTANAMRMVPAQLSDIATQLAGGQSPFLILTQQGLQMRDMFGGFGPMFRGLTNFISPATVALGAAGLAVTAIAAAFMQAQESATRFVNSLTATGNFAGMTSTRFDQLADSASRFTNSTAGAAREALQALISTGRLGPEALGSALLALLNMQRVTGQTAEELAKNYGRMGDDVAKWAAESNRSMHFMTEAQFRYIKSLQEKGQTERAQVEVYALLAKHHSANAESLGYIEQALKAVKIAASDAWQGLMKFGAPMNTGDRVKDLQRQIGAILDASGGKEPAAETYSAGRIQALRQQLNLIAQKAGAEAAAADAVAKAAAVNDKRIQAIQSPPKPGGGARATGPDAYQRLISDITKYREQSDLMEETTRRVSEADRWASEMKDRLRDSSSRLSPVQEKAVSAAIEAAAANRKQAESVVQQTEAERQFIAVMQADEQRQAAAVDQYLQGSAAVVDSYYEQMRTIGMTAVEIERITALRLLEAEAAKALVVADDDATSKILAAHAKRRASLEEFFEKRKAAEDALKGDASGGVRKGLQEWAEDASNRSAQVANAVKTSMDMATGSIMEFVKTGKFEIGNLVAYIAEQWLQMQIKMFLSDLIFGKGGGGGGGGVLGDVFDIFTGGGGSVPGFASGLSYVPYDGFPAILHEGERVLTRNEARAFRDPGGQPLTQTFYIGQGVTPAQVQMAMTEARRGAVAQAKGEILQSIRRQGAYGQ
ncbi:phage-related minor tail protein [Burkholderiales bacterium JOSHI_001]|nr:phage-related minor tail protein [Burkholderiales bacterium JOSHI_001]